MAHRSRNVVEIKTCAIFTHERTAANEVHDYSVSWTTVTLRILYADNLAGDFAIAFRGNDILLYCYTCTSVRFIAAITEFQVTVTTNSWALTRCIHVSYVVGHERVCSIFFQCVLSIQLV
jgi:hypothetical protein